MSITEYVLHEMERLGVPTDRVRVLTDVNQYLDVYRRVFGIDPEVFGLTPELLKFAGEEVLLLPSGEIVFYMRDDADWFTVHHAIAHAYVYRRVGVKLESVARTLSLCGADFGSLALALSGLTRNLLDDILADLAFRRILGNRYWEGARREIDISYRMLQNPINIMAMGPDMNGWLLHMIESVYHEENRTRREDEAIRKYMERPTLETALELLDTLVSIGRMFGVDVNTKTERGRNPTVYRLVLRFVFGCL